jgi:hypothetical protein
MVKEEKTKLVYMYKHAGGAARLAFVVVVIVVELTFYHPYRVRWPFSKSRGMEI